ncbi:acyltransferase family protein [Paludibacterium yongneupense]|uniref:acyltransferase family protein n=1 Tax=Paludibacterium yongneupense TaxID=400061 RepID=UPI00042626F9|nr:acyltransferase family protein [Paludibacterium yongneupense]
MGNNINYRQDIDGLRALAVLGVVIFHAFPKSLLSGGYIGVDIFFVISGFLITGILVSDSEHGKYSIMIFYQRRILRIFPALLTVLVTVMVFGYYILLPDEFSALGKNVAAGALFSSNISYWMESGYFDTSSAQKPLLHLWSLGVEEQFYIVWPLLILITQQNGKARRVMLLITGILSFLTAVYLTAAKPAEAFFAPWARYWELLAGGAVAITLKKYHLEGQRTMDWTSCLGLAMCLIPMAALDKASQFPGWLAFFPVAGAVALIAAGPEALVNRKVLSNRLAVGIGLISYPLYLWHWPILVYLHITEGGMVPIVEKWQAIGGAVFLAGITYFIIERPIRTGFFKDKKSLNTAGLSVAMIFVCTLGVNVYERDGMSFRLMKVSKDLTGPKPDIEQEWRIGRCFLEESSNFSGECIEQTKLKENKPSIFLWGDSHAASLYPGLKTLQHVVDFRIAQFTASGCEPYPTMHIADRPYCNDANHDNMKRVSQLRPALVLLHSRWQEKNAIDGLSKTIDAIREASPTSKIIVIGSDPVWNDDLPRIVFRLYRNYGTALPVYLKENNAMDIKKAEQTMQHAVETHHAEFISSVNVLCKQAGCISRVDEGNGQPMITSMDIGHLTPSAARYLVERIQVPILKALYPVGKANKSQRVSSI